MFVVEDPTGKLDREAKLRLDAEEKASRPDPKIDYRVGKLNVELSKKQRRADKQLRKELKRHRKEAARYDVLRPTG